MIDSRLALHNKLVSVLGNNNVYFQPPAKLQYPCIKYKLKQIPEIKASNIKYKRDFCYQVILIHQDPDNDIVEKLLKIPYTSFENHYSEQGLNYYVFEMYYK